MLSIFGPYKPDQAIAYFIENGTFGVDGEIASYWTGSAQPHIFLRPGKVEQNDVKQLLNGFCPYGLKSFAKNAGDPNRAAAWDLTFSAPKSVSVFWASADTDVRTKIEAIHSLAVATAFKFAEETCAFARSGEGGKIVQKAEWLSLVEQHGVSRNLEPQLHSHVVLFNLARCRDGEFRSLSTYEIYRAKMAIGSVYRAELAYLLQTELGLELRRSEHGFELAGISDRVIERFSSRRAEIKAKLEEFGGLKNAKAASKAAILTRAPKEFVPRAELFKRWSETFLEIGWGWAQARKLFGRHKPNPEPVDLASLIAAAVEKLTKHKTHFAEREVIREVIKEAQYLGISADEIISRVREGLKVESIVTLGNYAREPVYSTKEIIEAEEKLMGLVMEGKGNRKHIVPAMEVRKHTQPSSLSEFLGVKSKLTPDQEGAVISLTSRQGRIAILDANSGVDCNPVLGAARHVWSKSGFKSIGLSFTAAGTENLRRGAKIKSHSVHGALRDINSSFFGFRWGKTSLFPDAKSETVRNIKLPSLYFKPSSLKLDAKTVLVIDGAEKLSTEQMTSFVSEVERKGAKLVLVGNLESMRQFGPGAPLKHMAEKLNAFTLKELPKQMLDWKKSVIALFASGNAKGAIAVAKANDTLFVLKDRKESMDRLIANWRHLGLKNPAQNLILTINKEDANELNKMAQKARRKAWKVGLIETHIGANRYYKKDRIIFAASAKSFGIQAGALGTILKVNPQKLHVKLDNGKRVVVPLRYYNPKDIQLAYAIPISRAHGLSTKYAHALIDPERQDRHSSSFQAAFSKAFTRFYTDIITAGIKEGDLATLMAKKNEKELATAIGEQTGALKKAATEQQQQAQRQQTMSR